MRRDLHRQRVPVVDGRTERYKNTEEQDALVPCFLLLRCLVRGQSLDDPVERCGVDVDDVLAVEAPHDGELGTSDQQACRERLRQGDRMLLRVHDRVQVESERL